MPKHNADLSPAFLAAHRHRLDRFGPWTVDGGRDSLAVKWKAPPALANDWVPLRLRLETELEDLEPTPELLDPDEEMLDLLDLFAARRDEFLAQLRPIVAVPEGIVGPVARATVEVYRHRDGDLCECGLRVWFKFNDDDEHVPFSTYDPGTGAFGELDG